MRALITAFLLVAGAVRAGTFEHAADELLIFASPGQKAMFPAEAVVKDVLFGSVPLRPDLRDGAGQVVLPNRLYEGWPHLWHGHAEDAAFFRRRSESWKNLVDPETGFARARNAKGGWRTPFNPARYGEDYTEGNAMQYTFHVMQDVDGLIAACGGKEAFVRKLDAIFAAPDDQYRPADATGLIGQYAHGNEPSHHIAYLYALAGCPDRTAEIVREVFDRLHRPKPDGLCGNDDCGQMSAWYVFSAMGFYPVDPCGGEYVLGAPQVPWAQVKVRGEGERRTFRVLAKGLLKENKYVKSAKLI